MLPLCTSVTLFLPWATAYWSAARTSRSDPVRLTGLIPIPESSLIFQPMVSRRNAISFRASGVPSFASNPAYTSSVFSRNTTMSTLSGCRTGEGTPGNQRTGRRQTYRSSFWRSATLRLRIPPPTGVVRGPLMPTRCSRNASSVSDGSQSPVSRNAFSPARTGTHSTLRLPA